MAAVIPALRPPNEDKNFNLSDSIGILAILMAPVLWAFVPNLYTKIGALLIASAGTALLAYRSHWTGNFPMARKHVIAVVLPLLILGSGAYSLSLGEPTKGLHPRIEGFGILTPPPGNKEYSSLASIVVTIKIDGSPTIVENFQFKLLFPGGASSEGFLMSIPERGMVVNYLNGTALELAITRFVRNRNEADSHREEWLRASPLAFKGVSPEELSKVSTSAVLSMVDSSGKSYSTAPFVSGPT